MKTTKTSPLEDRLADQLDQAGIPYRRQERLRPMSKSPSHKFAKRLWRADFMFPRRIILEVQGGIWMARTGHTSGSGISADIEKKNAAAEMHYVWLEATPADVRKGTAVATVLAVLQSYGWESA